MADERRIHLHLTTGQGPAECRLALKRLIAHILEEAEKADITCDLAVEKADNRHGPASAMIGLSGPQACAFGERYVGSIQWVSKSPLRPHHGRRNWFVGIFALPEVTVIPSLDSADIRFETFRAGGPGGQSQNTTDSAVRAVHVPTGLSAISRDERSQHSNRKRAIERLAAQIEQWRNIAQRESGRSTHAFNHALERGNPVLVFREPLQ
jgi:peptide chain release factor